MDIVNLDFTGKETTQERLIKATQALIAIYGYDAMTTRMIANTAGVTLSAISFHFGSKEELTKAAVTKAAEDLVRSLFAQSLRGTPFPQAETRG